MRKLVALLLAAAMTLSGVLAGAAQDADSSFGDGIGSPAVWMDDRGNPMGSLEVTEVVAGWDGYDDRGEPARGYDYYAVNFIITNVGEGIIEIDPGSFSLVDNQGLRTSRKNISQAPESTENIISERFEIEPGASEEATLVFELFNDVTPALFVWQAASGSLVMVDVSDGVGEESAVVFGLNAPATFADDRGNVVGSVEVTDVEDGWTEHDDYYAPDRGNRYVAVHVRVTNLSDQPMEMNPSNFSLLDNESGNNGRVNISANEDAITQVSSDRIDLEPGESYDGMLVFVLFDSLEPIAVLWSPVSSALVVVVIDDSGVDADIDIDIAPDDEEDVEEEPLATPAA